MHGLDEYAQIESPIHSWETRYKIAGLFLLAFSFAFVESFYLLPFMLLVTAILYYLSNLPRAFLASRLQIPGLILLGIVISLPFFVGDQQTPLLSLGPIKVMEEGILRAVLIAVRFVCIITVSLLIFGTETIVNTIKGLIGLRLPPLMADMILLTYRYIFEMRFYLRRTQTAVRMRGFQNTGFSFNKLNTLASLLGNLIVRSYEQSERVYKAMIIRGYGANANTAAQYSSTGRDRLWFGAVILVALSFVLAQLYLAA
ncbi:MAG: cobalt ECF transporter T component CbiQ [Chloroflexota bacterium]